MKKEVFIHAQWNKYTKAFDYSTMGQDMSDYGYIFLEKQELEFETPPEKEMRVLASKALRAQGNKTLANAHIEAKALYEEADSLLALEFTPDEAKIDDDIPF